MLKFWELGPSPNNLKVRAALRFKGLDFEAIPVDPANREPVLRVSGQVLTPVIEDRGIVLNDSEAILQYLDANYRETPRLFPVDRDGRRACDGWKARLDEIAMAHWYPVFATAIGRRDAFEPSAIAGFSAWLGELENHLAGADSFGGADQAINDLRVAEWACYALPGKKLVQRSPLFARFKALFAADPDALPRLQAFLAPWNERLG